MAPFSGYAHNINIPTDIKDLKLSKITDNIYVVHGIQGMPDKSNKGFISNSGFVVSDEGVVIIDSGGSIDITVDFIFPAQISFSRIQCI